MKALVLSREGKKAVLLLPGGEMRTVRAQKTWRTGMEVRVEPYPARKRANKPGFRAILYPAAAYAAAALVAFIGLSLLGGNHTDHRQPLQPMTSGSIPAATGTARPQTSSAPDMPTAMPLPAASPTAAPDSIAVPVQPTPPGRIICDECGEFGHDDDDCPNERCDECGEFGHDDDNCPNERCDECGEFGHDDDNCPNERDHHQDHHGH